MENNWISLLLLSLPAICYSAYHNHYPTNTNGESDHSWPWAEHDISPLQSPVDIITSLAIPKHYEPLQVHGFNDETLISTLKNTGHGFSVVLNNPHKSKPFLRGAFLQDDYVFENLHCHWGSKDYLGSEHFIDGEGYPLEAHMVLYKKEYGNLDNAVKHGDGIIVLTFFAKLGERNTKLQSILDVLPHISQPKSTFDVRGSSPLLWFWNEVKANNFYYTYHGSLTTPPFAECVTFIVVTKPTTISHDQLEQMRHRLTDEHGNQVIANRRRIYSLRKRPIVYGEGIDWNLQQAHSHDYSVFD